MEEENNEPEPREMLRHLQTPSDTLGQLPVSDDTTVNTPTDSTNIQAQGALITSQCSRSSASSRGPSGILLFFSNFPSTDWPQFSPLTGNHLGPLFSLWPLPGAGSWLAQVSRNKRSRYGQFPYYPLSLQPGPGQIILEGDTGHGRPWEARGQFSLWGASPPARASPGGGINRTTENSRHGDQHGLHLQRLNKQKRYHRAYPPATLGSSRQIVTGIFCCNYKVRLRAGYFDNISY